MSIMSALFQCSSEMAHTVSGGAFALGLAKNWFFWYIVSVKPKLQAFLDQDIN